MTQQLSSYHQIIQEATGCAPEQLDDIEELMRDIIFHSTLDWKTRDELIDGAKQVFSILQDLDPLP